MMSSKKHEDDDPVLKAELERALTPYKALLPPDMLEVMRDILRYSLTEHPVGKGLLDRVRELEKKPRTKSGEETKKDAFAEPTPSTPSSGHNPRN